MRQRVSRLVCDVCLDFGCWGNATCSPSVVIHSSRYDTSTGILHGIECVLGSKTGRLDVGLRLYVALSDLRCFLLSSIKCVNSWCDVDTVFPRGWDRRCGRIN